MTDIQHHFERLAERKKFIEQTIEKLIKDFQADFPEYAVDISTSVTTTELKTGEIIETTRSPRVDISVK